MTSLDRRTLVLAVAALAALVATAAIGASGAVFSTQTANPKNTFNAAASFGAVRAVSGAYTDNAVDNRAISGPRPPARPRDRQGGRPADGRLTDFDDERDNSSSDNAASHPSWW